MWLVFGLNIEVDVLAHAPVQDLVVDRQVNLLGLDHLPDLGDGRIPGRKIGLGLQADNHLVNFCVAETGRVPGTTATDVRVQQVVEDVVRVEDDYSRTED